MKFHWGKGILVFFILFLSLCAFFIVFSLKQNNDLVTDDYYEQGANYSDQMDIKRRSNAYTDSIVLKQDEGTLSFYLSQSIVNQADSIELFFYRSSDKSEDFIIRKELDSSPININSEVLIHGRYKVKIGWSLNDNKYEVEKTLDVN